MYKLMYQMKALQRNNSLIVEEYFSHWLTILEQLREKKPQLC